MATSVAVVMMPSPVLRVEKNACPKLQGSSGFLSRRVFLKCRVPCLVSVGNDRLVVRNAVSTTEKRDELSLFEDDYAENFRPPHITDVFDVPARPSSFCAKTRSVEALILFAHLFFWFRILGDLELFNVMSSVLASNFWSGNFHATL